MKKSMKIFILTEVFLGAVLVLAFLMMLRERNGQEPERIVVIVQDSNSDQWSAFRYGLRAAAEDQAVDVFVVSTEKQLSVREEMRLMRNEAEHGADAVIIQPVPGMDVQEAAEALGREIPLMLVNYQDEGAAPEELPAANADDRAMGAELARELSKDCGGKPEGKTIGIVSEQNGLGVTDGREESLRGALEEAGAVISWSVNLFSGDGEEKSLQELPAVDFIVALDDRSLVAAGEESASNNLHGALVYGIGNSTEAVYYLDMGDVQCLIVPDDFNLGYRSLTEVAKGLANRFHKMEGTIVSHTALRREELFLKENQEILFTMNQ